MAIFRLLGHASLLVTFLLQVSCVSSESEALEKSLDDNDEPHVLSWETQWVNIDRREITHVSVPLSRKLTQPPFGFLHSRHKRVIYGEDDRVRIDPAADGKRFPYTSIVRVSTGCSGLMISERHVLTAAHCVHNGDAYIQSALLFLRVGYLKDDGDTKWFYVQRFFIPTQWKNITEDGAHQIADWDDYDFAVLEMADTQLGQERDIIKPGISGLFCDNKKSVHGADSQIEYVSFPDDKEKDAYWYVEGTVETESPHLLYFTGDATHGCSGAGIYAWDYNTHSSEYERRVIGVLSGNRDTVPFAETQGNFNVAVRLTPANFLLVCHWIGSEDECKTRFRSYLEQTETKLCKNL